MEKNKYNYTIKNISGNMIELTPKLNSITKRRKIKTPLVGIIELRCKSNIDKYRKEGQLVNCFGVPGLKDLETTNIDPIIIEKDQILVE
jgi:hypothetical protein